MSAGLEALHRHGLRPIRPEVIDSSMLKDFVDCESFFYLRHVLGLKKRYRAKADDAKFDWGTCWHGAQEVLWKTGDPVKALEYINLEFPDSVDPNSDRHKRSKDRMLKQFLEYYERFYDELNDEYELLRTEQFFDVYSDKHDLRWCGRIDKIRRRRRNGKIVIWDYKTASVMGPNYFNQHEFGFQFPGYTWAGNEMFTEPVEEVCLDVMYTLSASHEFFRRTFRYTPHQLGEWVRNVKMILDRMNYMMDNFLDQPEMWVKNWQHCTRYGQCMFTDIHFLAPIGDSRLSVLENDYYEERWDPILVLEPA